MVNQQLTDYVKQQVQGGVQKDAIKKALLDAGWPAADVDDSVNAAGAAASPAAAAQTFNPAAVMSGGKSAAEPMQAAGKGASFFSSGPKTEAVKTGKSGKTAHYIMGCVILILLGALSYLYLTSNRAPASGGSSGADVQALNTQIQQLTADKSSLNGQLTDLSAANQALAGELGFFATSTSSSTVQGVLSGTAGAYTVTTPHGIAVSLKYAKSAKAPDLKSLVGQEVQAVGVRTAGTLELWAAEVTAVNPPAATAPATATTSASTTAPAAPVTAPPSVAPPAAPATPPPAASTTSSTAP